MPRIAGVDLPKNKTVLYALTYIYGVGLETSRNVLVKAGVEPTVRTHSLSETDVSKIRNVLETDYKLEGDLRREVQMNVKRLMDLGCYRGLRHRKKLPVRGQRTRTNSRTRKGPRKAAVALKKAAPKK